MDQFWAPNWPQKSLKSAGPAYGDFRTRFSKRHLVPRSRQNGSRWPRRAQNSPQLAQKGSQNSPKMGQVGPRWPKIAAKLLQESPKIGQDGQSCCFCFAFAFPLLFLCSRVGGLPEAIYIYIYPSLSFGEYNSNSNSLCTPLV